MKAPGTPVQAVVFDISGTAMDHGSRAPATAFQALFNSHRVTVTEAEARAPMGLHKRDHLRAMLADPGIAARWTQRHGATPSESTVDLLYREFPAMQLAAIRRHLDLIPGVAPVAAALRDRGIGLGVTTGFESSMIVDIVPAAAAQGFSPDCWVCPDQAGGGRPAPWMIHTAARLMDRYPLRHFVKVGDTQADIDEARNAGTWAVAVTRTGNELGLSIEQWEQLAAEQRKVRLAAANARFELQGADYVIESVADLMPVVEEITSRISAGSSTRHTR